MPQKKLHIAMLEDDSDDRLLTEEITGTLEPDLQIDFFSSSKGLFNFLETTRPQLILVDDNSTPENGLEVLKRLKISDRYKQTPVVILSDSVNPTHRNNCYAAGASAVVINPTSLEETKRKIRSFFTYWAEVAEL